MRMLYLDCSMGAAGDMFSSALLELLPDQQGFVDKLNSLGIPNVHIDLLRENKGGIEGNRLVVRVLGTEEGSEVPTGEFSENPTGYPTDGSTGYLTGHPSEDPAGANNVEHHNIKDICEVINGLDIPHSVKADAQEVFNLIADAESKVHGKDIEQIHFHEVGTMDAVADIVSACLLMHEIAPDVVCASPITTGFGFVECAHGTLPVPAPATALILEGVPIKAGDIEGELCTPTGAALIKHFAESFCAMPLIEVEQIGYGLGCKNFARPNFLRAFLGETQSFAIAQTPKDTVSKLECNIDDMTPEALSFAMEILLEAGALDAFFTPVFMKKSRPAYLFTVLCKPEDESFITHLIFKHTSTIGIRRQVCGRHVLSRELSAIDTEFGSIRVKQSSGFGINREKIEFDDVAKVAKSTGLSLDEVIRRIDKSVESLKANESM